MPTFGRNKTTGSTSPSAGSTGTKSPSTPSGSGTTLKRTVSFDKVQIREFQQVLGDNPCKEIGPSLSLGWNYNEKKGVDLEKYESKRSGSGGNFVVKLTGGGSTSPRRKDFSLSPKARIEKALELGYTPEEIAKNQKQMQRIQKQREKTALEGRRGVPTIETGLFDAAAFIQAAKVAHGLE